VENALANIFRGGVTAGFKSILFTAKLSFVDETFSDASNTILPSANGQNGLIPSYSVNDLMACYSFSKQVKIKQE